MLLLGVFVFCTQLLAQNRTVTGTVTDDKGQPLANVSVTVKGANLGTITDEHGKFTLNVPENARTLVVSSVGFASTEAALGNKSTFALTLRSEDQNMSEVVVIAYGTAKKSEYTGSTAQINAKEIEKRPLMNVSNALVGSAPGIQTTTANGQPGSSPGIRLRGFGSYYGSSSPLFVVDGVPYDGGLANINPDDVESISTLKDASTTALYGSRGANGVIMITTKKGRKNRNQLTFKMTQGYVQRALPEYDRVNAQQYYPLMWEAYRNSLQYGAAVPAADANKLASGLYPRFTTGANAGKQNYNGNAYSDISQLLGYNPFNVAGSAVVREDGTLNPDAALMWADDLDWAGTATKGGTRQDYLVSYNGGNDKSDYFGSFGYNNEKGYLVNSDFKRFTGRLNVNTQPVSWFKTGMNLSGAHVNSNQANDGSGIVNPFYFSRYIGPIYPVYAHNPTTGEYLLDAKGERIYDYGSLVQMGLPTRPYNSGRHTIAENLWNQRLLKRDILSGRANGEVIFTQDLRLTSNISLDVQDALFQEYDNKLIGDGAPSGRARRTHNKSVSYTFNQLLNYAKKFDVHSVAVLLGHENYDYTNHYLFGSKQGQIAEGIFEFENFSTINSASSQTDKQKLESYFSRLSYDFDGKYFLTGSFRRDGNSRFSSKVRWDNFWSVGAAWRLDKEKFFVTSFVDELKPRASYGKVGNDAGIGYYPYQGLYNLGFNNGTLPGYVLGSLANDSLTWESSTSLDVGVDFSLFKRRLSGTVEYFNREIGGLIFSVPQPLSNGGTNSSTNSGALSVIKNIGSMYNRGFEAQLTGNIIRSQNFNWTANLNWTTFTNKITKMPAERPEIIDGTKKLSEGKSIYDFWLRDYRGVDPTDGAALYTYNVWSATNGRIIGKDSFTVDANNAKYIYTGASSIPDFYGSFGNNFSYKNFEVSFMLTYQVGGKVYDGVYGSLMNAGSYGNAMHVDIQKRWQKPGDVTDVPRLDNSKLGVFDVASDRWLTDASYLSVNNLSVGYSFSRGLLSKINAQSAKVYVSGENLYFFSKRKGMSVNGSFNGTTGDSYNVSRVITAGVNLTF